MRVLGKKRVSFADHPNKEDAQNELQKSSQPSVQPSSPSPSPSPEPPAASASPLGEQVQLRRSASLLRIGSFSRSPTPLDDSSAENCPPLPCPSPTTAVLRPAARNDAVEVEESAAWAEKKRIWVEDHDQPEGYLPATTIDLLPGDKAKILLASGKEVLVDANSLQKMNPPKFDKVEDMAELTYLNELSVLHNLKERYHSNLIYTYSGLFLIAVNPYRELPIYTDEILKAYGRKKRKEAPPHVYAVADMAYRLMLENNENQSILITGESGAGKTENTKKVIQYLAAVAAERSTESSGTVGLDAKLLAANPILEAFGNAQTVRNNNSSRFGKFIKVEFNAVGQISSAYIERYLLEKSRVTHQSPKERNFHIFYQFLAGAPASLKQSLFIDGGVNDYAYVKGSNKKIEGVDDVAEWKALCHAMDVIQLGEAERLNFFKIIAAILLMGNLKFAEDESGFASFAPNGTDAETAEKVCRLLGVNMAEFSRALLRPRIKAGKDWVMQERSVSQVVYSVEALCRSLYERMFGCLLDKINQSMDKPSSRTNFIGVLDIAGFEIFESNSFEQLCINFTNEKLQQFFNHHMFVQEQNEYKNEGLEWKYMDFGLDLQPVIDLIEKNNPIGIFPCLDEECVMPKATDKTFGEKLNAIWKGRSPNYDTHRFNEGFSLKHYAGKVEYTTEGWLEKNKDPINENITRILAKSSDAFIGSIFVDYFGDDDDVEFINKCKKGAFRTVAQKHREQLNSLMSQLNAAHPHFIRCILPNDEKKTGKFNAKMVLYQLKCNGVLEGIRVTRQGYPNRLFFLDFVRRYQVICCGSNVLSQSFVLSDTRKSVITILESAANLDPSKYRIGHSKVFFKAGVLADLEDMREQQLCILIQNLQTVFRMFLCRKFLLSTIRNKQAIVSIQRSARNYANLREWPWWKLFSKIRPLLKASKIEVQVQELTQTVTELQSQIQGERSQLARLSTEVVEQEAEKKKIESLLLQERQSLASQAEVLQLTRERQRALEDSMKVLYAEKITLEERLFQGNSQSEALHAKISKLESNLAENRSQLERLERETLVKNQQLHESSTALHQESAKYAQILAQKRELEERISLLQQSLSQAEQQAASQAEQIASLSQLQHSNSALMEENAAKEAEHSLCLTQLRDQLKAKEREIAALETQLSEGQAQWELVRVELTSKLTSKDEALTQVKEERGKLERDFAELQQAIQKKGDEAAKHSEMLSKMKDEEMQSVKEKLEASINAKNELSLQLETLSQEATSLRHSKASLESNLLVLSQQVDQCESTLAQLEKDKKVLESENHSLAQAHSQLVALRAEHSTLKEAHQQLTASQAKLQAESSLFESALEQSKVELADALQAKSAVEEAKKSLTASFLALSQKLDNVEVQANETERRLASQLQEQERLAQCTASELDEAIQAKQEAEALAMESQLKIQQLSSSLSFTEKTKTCLLRELEDCRVEVERLSQEHRNLDRLHRTSSAQLEATRFECAQVKRQYEDLQSSSKATLKSLERERNEACKFSSLLKIKEHELEELHRELEDQLSRKAAIAADTASVSSEEQPPLHAECISRSLYEETIERYEGRLLLASEAAKQQEETFERLRAQQLVDEQEKEALRLEIKAQSKKASEELQNSHAQLQDFAEQLRKKEAEFTYQIADARTKADQLREENQDLTQKAYDYLADIGRLNEQLDCAALETEKLTKYKRTLTLQIEELTTQISSASTTKLDDLQARRRQQAEIDALNEQAESLRQTINELSTELSLAYSKQAAQGNSIEVLEAKVGSLERQRSLLEAEVAGKDAAIAEATLKFTHSQSKASSLEAKAQAATDQSHALSLQLQEALGEKKRLLSDLEVERALVEGERQEKSSLVLKLEARIQSELASLLADLSHTRQLNVDLAEQKNSLEQQIASLSNSLSSEQHLIQAIAKEKAQIECKLDELKVREEETLSALSQKDSQITALQTQITSLQAANQAAANKTKTLENQAAEITALHNSTSKQVTLLQAQLEASQQQLQQSTNELTYLRSFAEEGGGESKRLKERLLKAEESNAALLAEITTQKTLVLALQSEKNALDRQIREHSIRTLEWEASALAGGEGGKRAVDEQLQTLRSHLEEALRERQEQWRECKRIERTALERQSALEEATAELHTLQASSAKLTNKLSALAQTNEQLEGERAELLLKSKRQERLIDSLGERIRQLEAERSRALRGAFSGAIVGSVSGVSANYVQSPPSVTASSRVHTVVHRAVKVSVVEEEREIGEGEGEIEQLLEEQLEQSNEREQSVVA